MRCLSLTLTDDTSRLPACACTCADTHLCSQVVFVCASNEEASASESALVKRSEQCRVVRMSLLGPVMDCSINNSDDRSTKFIPGRALLAFCRSDGTSPEHTRNARAFRDRSALAVNIAQALCNTLHSWSSSTCEGQSGPEAANTIAAVRTSNE